MSECTCSCHQTKGHPTAWDSCTTVDHYGGKTCPVCRQSHCGDECITCDPCCSYDPCSGLALVRYSIVFTRRGLEVAFPEREELVETPLCPEEFTAWKIAEFISHLECIPLPPKWRAAHYPYNWEDGVPPACAKARDEKCKNVEYPICFIPQPDQKYLRVYCQQLAEYPRQKFHYEEDQVATLEQINRSIQELTKAVQKD